MYALMSHFTLLITISRKKSCISMMSDNGPGPATYSSGQQVLMLPYYAMRIIDAVLCIECSIRQMSLSSITHCSCASRQDLQNRPVWQRTHPPTWMHWHIHLPSPPHAVLPHTLSPPFMASPLFHFADGKYLGCFAASLKECLLAIGQNPKHFSTHSLCIGGTRHCPLSHPRPWVLAKQLL